MRKRFKCLLVINASVLLASILLLLTGCGFLAKFVKEGAGQLTEKGGAFFPKNSESSKKANDPDDDRGPSGKKKTDDNGFNGEYGLPTDDVQEIKDWPQKEIPDEVPEYKKGNLISAGGDKETYVILVETNRDDLKEYLDRLEDEGWYVDRDYYFPYAKYNNIEIAFDFYSDTEMIISVYTQAEGVWPDEDDMPSDIIKPDKGVLMGDVRISDLGEREGEMITFSFDVAGLSTKDVENYIQKYRNEGWKDDGYNMLSKNIEWKGRRYKATIEAMEFPDEALFTVALRELL
ncbi:MAG: hypothetical protein PHV32_05705 [Eubacteriales bacterium]|nr:hypothetical protein [Eubacteriales bacterium]